MRQLLEYIPFDFSFSPPKKKVKISEWKNKTKELVEQYAGEAVLVDDFSAPAWSALFLAEELRLQCSEIAMKTGNKFAVLWSSLKIENYDRPESVVVLKELLKEPINKKTKKIDVCKIDFTDHSLKTAKDFSDYLKFLKTNSKFCGKIIFSGENDANVILLGYFFMIKYAREAYYDLDGELIKLI